MSKPTKPAITYNRDKNLVEDFKNHSFCKQLDAYHNKRGRHGVARTAAVAADIRRVIKESDFETFEEWDELDGLFSWRDSEDGHDYWKARAGTTR